MRLRVHAALFLAPLLLLLPLLVLPLPSVFGSTDALFYTLMMKLSGREFLMGDIWPRWLMDADAGLGAPLMVTYPPLPYLLSALLSFPFAPLGDGARMLAAMLLATIASGYAALFWLKRHFPMKPALFGAMLYMLLPYRLVYMYLHFNLAQLWALALLPLWMASAEEMLQGKRRGAALFALCAALVCYTHPLTLLAFGAVPVAYVCWLGRTRLREVLLPLAGGIALAGAMMLSYIASFALGRGWFAKGGMSGTGFTSGRFELLSNLSHVDSALISYYLAIALMVFLLARRVKKMPDTYRFWIVALPVLWFMTTRFSVPMWHVLPFLQYLQFPAARLHAGMLVAVAFLSAGLLSYRGKQLPLFLRPVALWALIAVATTATLVRVLDVYDNTRGLTAGYVQAMQQHEIVYQPWYKLRWSSMSATALYKQRERISALPQASIFSGNVQVERWQPGSITLLADAQGLGAVTVRQRYLPAWQAFDNTTRLPVTVKAIGEEGMIAFKLPPGRHEVQLTFDLGLRQTIADLLSAAALLSALFFAFPKARRA